MRAKLSDNADYNKFIRQMRLKRKTIISLTIELERETGKSRFYCRKIIMLWKLNRLEIAGETLNKFMKELNALIQ